MQKVVDGIRNEFNQLIPLFTETRRESTRKRCTKIEITCWDSTTELQRMKTHPSVHIMEAHFFFDAELMCPSLVELAARAGTTFRRRVSKHCPETRFPDNVEDVVKAYNTFSKSRAESQAHRGTENLQAEVWCYLLNAQGSRHQTSSSRKEVLTVMSLNQCRAAIGVRRG